MQMDNCARPVVACYFEGRTGSCVVASLFERWSALVSPGFGGMTIGT
jgi:hypothetical protein